MTDGNDGMHKHKSFDDDRRPAAGRRAWALVLGAILACGRVQGGTALDETETWSGSGTAGWTNDQTGATLDNPGGCLEITFGGQERPAFAADAARRPLAPGTLLTNVSLRLSAMGVPPSRVHLCLHSRLTGATWYLRLPPPAEGSTREYNVPLTTSAGWSMGPSGTATAFDADLRTADWVGVLVRRHGSLAAQRYRLDDVRLQGLAAPEDRDLDGMENDWETGHGLNADDPRDAGEDPDLDTMSNFAEARAGTDPTNAASRLVLRIRPASEGRGVTLEWDSIANRRYTLWRVGSLDEPLQMLRAGIDATPSLNTFEDPGATNAATGYYRMVVDP
jgi:hypothetical protein